MTTSATTKSAAEIPTADAARLLMISAERIRQLQKDGYIPRGKRGHVSLVGAVQGYIRFRDDADRRANKSAAESRVRDARAKEIELRNAVRLRELVPVEEATAALDLTFGAMVAELDGLPARITRDMPLRRKIDDEIIAARYRMVARIKRSTVFIETGGELPYSSNSD